MDVGIEPLADRVLVKVSKREEMTKGGILLPEIAKENLQEGEVVAIGPGRINERGILIPITVKVGQKVIYAKYAGAEIKKDESTYLILKEEEVLATIGE